MTGRTNDHQHDPIFGKNPFAERLAAREEYERRVPIAEQLERARSTMIESGRYDVVLGIDVKLEEAIPLGELEVRDRRSGAIVGRIVGLAGCSD